jgi:hypothetical protein
MQSRLSVTIGHAGMMARLSNTFFASVLNGYIPEQSHSLALRFDCVRFICSWACHSVLYLRHFSLRRTHPRRLLTRLSHMAAEVICVKSGTHLVKKLQHKIDIVSSSCFRACSP